jgi:hypothetical protein
LAVGYGYEVKEPNDQKVNAARKMVQLIGEIGLPGALLVNDLPFCECSLWCRTSSMLIHTSTAHSRMDVMVELQAARSLWLRFGTGGFA